MFELFIYSLLIPFLAYLLVLTTLKGKSYVKKLKRLNEVEDSHERLRVSRRELLVKN